MADAPFDAVEREPATPAGAERIEHREVLGAEAPVAGDLEGPDAVRLALLHRQVQDGLSVGRVDGDRIPDHLEIHVALAAVPAGQPLPEIVLQLVVVVLPLLPPEEPLGAGGHPLHQRLVGELLVAVHLHLADGDPVAFLDIEHHAGLGRAGAGLDHLDGGGVVALGVVQRVDRRAGAFDRRAVERTPLGQLHPVLDRALGQPLDALDRPAGENRALLHPDEQYGPFRGVVDLTDGDVVELAGAEQRGDGPLDVAIIDGLAEDQAGAAENLLGGQSGVAFHRDAVEQRGRQGLGLLPGQHRRPGGQRQQREQQSDRAHAEYRAMWDRRSLVRPPAGGGRIRPWSRSARGMPAVRRRARRPPRSRRSG